MHRDNRFTQEEAKGVVTSSPLVSPSASDADDLPPQIGTLAVRLVARWSRPRIKLQGSAGGEADPCADAS